VRVLGAALREAASEGVSGAASALRWQGYSGRSARSGSASPRLRRKRPSRWPSRWPSRPWTRKKARCPASRTTLTPEGRARTAQRQEVRREPELVLAWCRPDLIPPGRWVTATDRPLAFSQQLAVNRIMHQHGDGQPGLFAVNGQPGTGKTSMLRDVVAEVPVRRAAKLAGLRSPQDAFTGEMTTWATPAWTHRISRLRPELAGDEIVVASSNNAAVENVTAEIPGPGGVADEWRAAAADVDCFTATARQVTGPGAWALLAAVLGNSGHRGTRTPFRCSHRRSRPLIE